MKAPSLDRLRALEALLRTKSPSSAAVELGVTPSTINKTLGQLRTELKDQLLVRRGDQTILTRRAERLVEPLGATLRALETLFDDDLRQAHRAHVAIAMRDQFVLALAPAVMRRLAVERPETTLKILPYHRDRLFEEMMRGTVDVAVAADPPEVPELVDTLLYRDTFVCLTSDRVPLTLETYLRTAHVATAHSGSALIDGALARMGYKRRVVAYVPHFAALLRVVASQRLCATVPSGVVRAMQPHNVYVHPAPLAIPDLPVSMVWHRTREADPDNRWLREVLMAAATAGANTS
jgi:LysR family transcriptional regulator, mexEF-oprN operon transcriptional activator